MKTTKLLIALAVALLTATTISCTSSKEEGPTTTIGDIQIVGADSASAERVQGAKSLTRYLQDSIRYPQEAIDRCARGCVVVQFAVDSMGKVCDERVVQSIDPQLDGEVIRLVRSMPRWEPTQQSVHYTLPITFHLPGDTITDDPKHIGISYLQKLLPKRPYIILTLADSTSIMVSGKQLHPFKPLPKYDYLEAFGLTSADVTRVDSLSSAMAESKYGTQDEDGAVVYHVKDKPLSEVTDTLSRYWYFHRGPASLRVEILKPGATDAQVEEYQSELEEAFINYNLSPEFPGGMSALMDYINANKIYPQEAKEKGVKGRVIVQYVIDVDGSICGERVLKSIDPQLDAEAIRILRNLPNWKPGEMYGTPVPFCFTLPVTFRLE